MGRIQRFEDVPVWQKSKEFNLSIYNLFGKDRDFNFRDQIQRAAISIMNNIAEGWKRNGNTELIRFLTIAKGSSGEVRSMLHLARGLNKINEGEFIRCYDSSIEISKMLGGFIRNLKYKY